VTSHVPIVREAEDGSKSPLPPVRPSRIPGLWERRFHPEPRQSDKATATVLIVYTNTVYTPVVLAGLRGFEWDVHNVGHIARHGVTPAEVEQVTGWRHVIVAAASRRNEKRWKLFGRTNAGRFLVVVFTIRHRRMRTVTAYPMNQAERRFYASQIGS